MLSPHVVEVEAREPYKLWVRFHDGVAGVVDLSDSAAVGGIFSAWTDEDYWRTAQVVTDSGAVAWGDGADIDACPFSLYLEVTGRTLEDLGTPAASTANR